eukprot:CAMPEP_0116899786 /NCGR_PEP_ID=MMETSP0467-20121206/8285_1 /TAXON_ID=283647 /ORGANISM="Mesodinium pulex, Strain SPMC105" /LENGTH=65 /DNA_ID=CAMNT_0004572815 /DNA_START=35 /DNA_END=232 /DNA_ORIENTATION=-
MPNKPTVTIVSKKGGAKDYTVNQSGQVHGSHKTFLANNGGCVGSNTPVQTPISCKGGVCSYPKPK